MPKYADPAVYPVGTPAATDNVMTRTAAGTDGNFALGNLAGIAGLTAAADLSLYYNGTAWATYTVTSVGRTLLAATTQAAQVAAIGAIPAPASPVDGQSVYFNGTAWVVYQAPRLGFANVWNATNTFNFGITIANDQLINLGSNGAGARGTAAGIGVFFATSTLFLRAGGNSVMTGQITLTTTETTVSALLAPATDNAIDVGLAARRIRTYYGVNSAINTSDARLKTEPRHLSEAERKAGSELARLPAIWEWLTGDRLHAGPTVQAAMAVMEANGLDPFAYSFICYDEWEAEPEQWHEWEAEEDPETGEVTREAGREQIQPAREAGNRYSFRKEELLCFMVSALAAENDLHAAKVEAMDARLAAIEART
ncbi:tail fiber domain-containing protein [Stenotrophomonas africana]